MGWLLQVISTVPVLSHFLGQSLGVSGGIVTGVHAYRLKTQKRLLAIKAAAYVGVLATVPLYVFFAYLGLTAEMPDRFATLELLLFPLAIALFVSLCVRLVANWDLKETQGT